MLENRYIHPFVMVIVLFIVSPISNVRLRFDCGILVGRFTAGCCGVSSGSLVSLIMVAVLEAEAAPPFRGLVPFSPLSADRWTVAKGVRGIEARRHAFSFLAAASLLASIESVEEEKEDACAMAGSSRR
jgi:hypothetical protein